MPVSIFFATPPGRARTLGVPVVVGVGLSGLSGGPAIAASAGFLPHCRRSPRVCCPACCPGAGGHRRDRRGRRSRWSCWPEVCPWAVSSPVSSNREPGAGSVPCCLISSVIRDPGHAQLAADLGVGQALARLQAGLPQPGGAEDRRAADLVHQPPGAVRAVAGPDFRDTLGGLEAERGGDGLALEAAALGQRADRPGSRISRSAALNATRAASARRARRPRGRRRCG